MTVETSIPGLSLDQTVLFDPSRWQERTKHNPAHRVPPDKKLQLTNIEDRIKLFSNINRQIWELKAMNGDPYALDRETSLSPEKKVE